MQHHRLGKSELKVSSIGLGCMGMSAFYGERDDAESLRTLSRSLDLGVNFWDTADAYGPHKNEELLSSMLREHRDDVVLATKFGFVPGASGGGPQVNGKPDYVRKACEGSLRRLGVKTIDLYYLHRLDPHTPIEETVGAMAELVQEGKVRYLGLSEVSSATLRRANAVHPITAVQSEYSMWTRDPEDAVLKTCRELGIAFVAYSPLGRGFLTGRYRGSSDLPAEDTRRNHPRFQDANLTQNLRLVEEVRTMAREKGCTPGQLALAWVLHRGEDIVPIPGTHRQDHLEENVGACDIRLSSSDLERIDRIAPRHGTAGERYPPPAMRMLDK